MAELTINIDDITSALRKNLEGFKPDVAAAQVGRVLEVGDGIATVSGLPDCAVNELLAFEHDTVGLALTFEPRLFADGRRRDFAGLGILLRTGKSRSALVLVDLDLDQRLRQRRLRRGGFGQHPLDELLVVAVGEGLVAAHGPTPGAGKEPRPVRGGRLRQVRGDEGAAHERQRDDVGHMGERALHPRVALADDRDLQRAGVGLTSLPSNIERLTRRIDDLKVRKVERMRELVATHPPVALLADFVADSPRGIVR